MADHSDGGGDLFTEGMQWQAGTEKPDAPVFIATAVGYGANLAALILLARRFLHHGESDGATAWAFIALCCIAAAIVGALILYARERRRTRKGRGRWNWQGA